MGSGDHQEVRRWVGEWGGVGGQRGDQQEQRMDEKAQYSPVLYMLITEQS